MRVYSLHSIYASQQYYLLTIIPFLCFLLLFFFFTKAKLKNIDRLTIPTPETPYDKLPLSLLFRHIFYAIRIHD